MLLSKMSMDAQLLLTQPNMLPELVRKSDLYTPKYKRLFEGVSSYRIKLWVAGRTWDGKLYAARRVVIDEQLGSVARRAERREKHTNVEKLNEIVQEYMSRERVGINEVARRIGIDRQVLYHMLSRKTKEPAVKTIIKLVHGLHLTNAQIQEIFYPEIWEGQSDELHAD